MKKRRNHFRIPYIITGLFVLLLVGIISWYTYRKSDPTCGKWLFFKKGTQPVKTVADAITVFSGFLPSQPYYANHTLPTTLEGYKKKYNLTPFKSIKIVRNQKGNYVKKEVYDMLLAYAVDKNGAIYMYNQCALLH